MTLTRTVLLDLIGLIDSSGTYTLVNPMTSTTRVSRYGQRFTVCEVEGQKIVVALQDETFESWERELLATTRPDWAFASVFVETFSRTENRVSVANSFDPGAFEHCAAAAVCVLFNRGDLHDESLRYTVARTDGGRCLVTMCFDWGSESWRGESSIQMT